MDADCGQSVRDIHQTGCFLAENNGKSQSRQHRDDRRHWHQRDGQVKGHRGRGPEQEAVRLHRELPQHPVQSAAEERLPLQKENQSQGNTGRSQVSRKTCASPACVSLALCLCELYPSLQLLLFSHYYYSLKYTQRSIVLLVSCCFVIYSQRSGENPIHSCCFKISAYLFRLNQTHSKLRQINLQAFSENKTKNITNEAVFGSLALGNTLRNLLFWVQ